MAKQAKTAFLHGPTVWKSPIVGTEPTTFRSKSDALTTAPWDPTRRDDGKLASQGEENFAWKLISYIFQCESYEIKFPTKISSFTVISFMGSRVISVHSFFKQLLAQTSAACAQGACEIVLGGRI